MKIDVMLRVEIREEGREIDPFDLAEEVKMVIYDLPEVYDVTLLAMRPRYAKKPELARFGNDAG